MKIYSRTGATSIVAGDSPIEPDDDGGFNVPVSLGEQLITFHGPDGQLFESGAQRNDRLAAEDEERRNSPAALHDLLEQFLTVQLAAKAQVKPKEPTVAEGDDSGDGNVDASSDGTADEPKPRRGRKPKEPTDA